MRLSSVRVTVRRMMLFALLAAVLVKGEMTRRRVASLLELSQAHGFLELKNRRSESANIAAYKDVRYEAGPLLAWARMDREAAEWHSQMKQKYRRAAWMPFLEVPKGPPAPFELYEGYDPRH